MTIWVLDAESPQQYGFALNKLSGPNLCCIRGQDQRYSDGSQHGVNTLSNPPTAGANGRYVPSGADLAAHRMSAGGEGLSLVRWNFFSRAVGSASGLGYWRLPWSTSALNQLPSLNPQLQS